jgi:hypothetical protein
MRSSETYLSPRAFWRRMGIRLAISGALLAVCAMVVLGATRPTPFRGGLQLTDSNGSIVHSNSRAGLFIFQASNMVPGGSASGTVTLTNQDALEGDFVLSESNLVDTQLGSGGGGLAHQLSLKIEDVTNPASPTTLYPVANPNGPVDDKLADVGTLHVATIPAGQSRTFKFTATFPNGGVPPSPSSVTSGDNAYQGAAMSTEFDWTSTSLSGSLFPVPGLLGMNAVRLNNGGTVVGDVSSNGQVTINNRVTVSQVVLGMGAPNPTVKNSPTPPISRRPVPFNQLSPVDPGNSATTNANGQIQSAGGVSYTSSTRQLSLNNNATLTLAGGTYNFCSLSINNGSTLAIATGAKARIIIDSPDRPGSGCPKNSGDFSVNNNSKISNPSTDVSAAEILVTGLNNLSSTVTFNNSSAFYGAIYAPRSTVNVNNNTLFHGGLAALVVNFNNAANFEWDSAVSGLS